MTPPGSRRALGVIRSRNGVQHAYRVAGTWGALSPPRRPLSMADVATWSRFDIPGGQTVYAGITRRASMAEVLAYFRMPVGKKSGLEKDAAFLGLTPEEFAELVEEEWQRSGHMPPGHIARSWRESRLLHVLTLPESGWWVVLDHMDTIGVLEDNLKPILERYGIESLTISHLTGENRDLTVSAAAWLYTHARIDGVRPHGIIYPSKHGGADGFAYWMRTGEFYFGPESLTADAGSAIPEDDEDLRAVARRFDLHIH